MQSHIAGPSGAMESSAYPMPPDQRPRALPHPDGEWQAYSPQGSLFCDITQAVSAVNQVPHLLCAQAALAVGALVLQTQVTVERPNDGTALPVSQLVIGIAESGERKSKIINDFMAPVTAYLAAQEQKRAGAWQRYEEELEHWEKTRKRLVNARAIAYADKLTKESDGESDNEGGQRSSTRKESLALEQAGRALERLKKAKPVPPKQASIGILSDATPQAIPKFIKERGSRSLGIFTPEGEEILTNGIKHKSSILNKGYSGEATQRYRVGEGDQSYAVPITTCIFVQPSVAERAFGEPKAKMRGTGTLARALIAFPLTTQGNRLLTPPDVYHNNFHTLTFSVVLRLTDAITPIKSTKKRYRRWVSDKLHRADQHSGEERVKLTLSREAQALWYQAFNECELEIRQGFRYANFRDHASKLPDQWLRVATIIHCYDHGLSGEISADTLRTAIKVVNVFSTHFQKLFPSVSEEDKNYLSMQNYLNDKRQSCRYLPKKVVTVNGPLRPVSRANIALNKMHERREIAFLPYQNYTYKGQPTKPTMVIDLFPNQPHDQWALSQAVESEFRLSRL